MRMVFLPALSVTALSVGMLGATVGRAQSVPGIVSINGARSSVTMLFAPARDLSLERERLSRFVVGCREVMDVSAGDSASLVARVSPSPPELAAHPQDVIELVVMPLTGLAVNCGAANTYSGLLESRGLWVSFDTAAATDRRITAVSFSRGDRPLEPVGLRQGSILGLGPNGLRNIEAQHFRFVLRLADLMPSATEPSPVLQIAITTGPGGAPDHLRVPWSALREVLAATFALRPVPSGLARPSINLPVPQSPSLREAAASFDAGRLDEAARQALEQLQRGELHQADRTWARAMTGLVFALASDTLAARVSFELLLTTEPCFSWTPDAPMAARELLAVSARPEARCEGLSTSRVAARSLIVPGFGRPAEQGSDLPPRLGFATLVVGSAALSQVLRLQARAQYEDYLAAQIIAEPTSDQPQRNPAVLHARASQTRALGIAFVAIATASYVTQLGISVIAERRYARRLRAVGTYGAEPRTPRVELQSLTDDFGQLRLGLEVRW